MRSPKIIGATVLLITLPVIIESCCFTSCGCGGSGFEDTHFDINAMELSLLPNPAPSSPSLSAKLSAISLEVSMDVTYAEVRTPRGYSLYACDYPPPSANQTVTAIDITSDHVLTTSSRTIAAGESLNALFKVYGNNRYGDAIEFFTNSEIIDSELSFRSDERASVTQTHVFTIVITLDNGKVFKMTSTAIEIIAG